MVFVLLGVLAAVPVTSFADDHGDYPDKATSLPLDVHHLSDRRRASATIDAQIESPGDIDYFEIGIPSLCGNTRAGGILTVSTTGGSTVVDLFDAVGRSLRPDGFDDPSTIRQTVAVENYKVRVRQAGSGIGSYTLEADFHCYFETNPDEDESNSFSSAAGGALQVSISVSAPYEPVSQNLQSDFLGYTDVFDNEYLRVHIPKSGTLEIFTTGIDTYGELIDNDGKTLSSDGDDGRNFHLFQSVDVLPYGKYYYLLVRNLRPEIKGPYTLVARLAANGEQGNSPDTATPIDYDSTTAGDIYPSGENDFFRLDIPMNGILELTTTGNTDTYGDLLSSEPRQIAADDDSGDGRNFRITQPVTAGTYYVRVRHVESDATGKYTLISSFSPQVDLPLTVNNSGGGTVISVPGGIDCGATCAADFADGTTVELTATPATGYAFSGWSGACNGIGSCSVSMTTDRSVAATFTEIPPPEYTLTVNVAGTGSGTVGGGGTYVEGNLVTPTASADAGSTFDGWTPASCRSAFALTADTTCTATFTKIPGYTLRLSSTGKGIVTSSPDGIDCGDDCEASASYPIGTRVTLTAQPEEGFQFLGWGGACSGTAETCQVTMDADQAVRAEFEDDFCWECLPSRGGWRSILK